MAKSTITNENKKELPFKYGHARPNVAVNCVAFCVFPERQGLYVFIEHRNEWEEGEWGLPGRILRCSDTPDDEFGEGNETIEDCAERLLTIEYEIESKVTRIINNKPQQSQVCRQKRTINLYDKSAYDKSDNWGLTPLPAQSEITRDDRFRCIAIPLMVFSRATAEAETDDTQWVLTDDILAGKINLKYADHATMVRDGILRLRDMSRTQPISKNLVDEEFTISQIINIYQAIFAITLDRSNFKKTMIEKELIESTGRSITNGHRRVELFRFNSEKYDDYKTNKCLAFKPCPKASKEELNAHRASKSDTTKPSEQSDD